MHYGTGSVWLPAKIVESTGPVSFRVVLEDGRNRRCHQDQLRPWVVDDGPPEMSEVSVDAEGEAPPITTTPVTPTSGSTEETSHPEQGPEQPVSSESASTLTPPIDTNTRRYPLRQRKTRDRKELIIV